MGAEKFQQRAVEKCRLEAEMKKYQLDAQECGEEIGELRTIIEELHGKIKFQPDQNEFLNSQHEHDLHEAHALTQRLDDEAMRPSRRIQVSCGEPEFCEKNLVDSFQQTEEDFAQLQLRWEHEFDSERQINAGRLQQVGEEKYDAQDDLAKILIELGGLREKVHSSKLELRLQRRQNEEERQDEERERARRDDEQKKQEDHLLAAKMEWKENYHDKRTYEEFLRDHGLLTERHDFDQQFPEYYERLGADGPTMGINTTEQGTETDAEVFELLSECLPPIPSLLWSLEPVGVAVQTEKIETMEQCTGTDADELRLLDGCSLDIGTRERSTEIDAEEMESRSACVSPAASSLMPLISSR